MDFSHFLNQLPKIAKVQLPGDEAHLKMSPPERQKLMSEIDLASFTPRMAAVLMLVYPKNHSAMLVLIKRTTYNGVHSSQFAFPGGKIESYDASKWFAALRETEEEIGIPRSQVSLICPFSEVYIPPSNFIVAPFLGYSNTPLQFIPDPREVSGIIEIPLKDLLDDSNISLQLMATSYSQSIEVPVFNINGSTIWGATAMMLSELREVLKIALT